MPASTLPLPRLDTPDAPWLPPLPRAFLRGEQRALLEPLHFVTAGDAPPAARPGFDRSALGEALVASNEEWGHPRATALGERFADPRCRVVVTGQQTGLFGGPLYALSKAAAAVGWARHLEAHGVPAVPLFWMATEDHDYREVASSALPGSDGLERLALGEGGAGDDGLQPVGTRTLGAGLVAVLERLAAQGDPRYARAAAVLARSHRPEVDFGTAFARWFVELMGEDCPLLLDARLPKLKEQQRPWLRGLVERRHEVERCQQEADARIEGAGFSLQVTPQAGASPLFAVRDGERRRIQWRGDDRFELRGLDGSWPVSVLLEQIDQDPASVSPGVLARPLLQDAVLGTALMLLGPGELSYLPQVAPLYDLFEVAAPAVTLRPQLLILEPRQRDWLVELDREGLPPSAVLGPWSRLEERLAARRGPDPVSDARADVLARLDSLHPRLLDLDATLERPWQKTRDQVERALDVLGDKTRKAAARQDEVVHRRVRALRERLLPDDRLHERVLGVAHFYARHGAGLTAGLLAQLELDPAVLQLIVLEVATSEDPEAGDG